MATSVGKVKKRTLSEAEVAARRANSLKSTGPKNTENSRFNRVTHGMRAKLPVLPGESQTAYVERLDQWMEDFAPENSAQSFLVQRAVDLSFKLERGDSVEAALAMDVGLQAQKGDPEIQGAVDRLGEQLWEGGGAAAEGVARKSSFGCLWLLSQWEVLLQELEKHRRLYGSERKRVLQLQAKQRLDIVRSDPVAIKWLTAMVGAAFSSAEYDMADVIKAELGTEATKKLHTSELDLRLKELAAAVLPQPQSLGLLRAYFAETIAELKEHLESVRELEDQKRAIALERARDRPG